MIYQYVGRNEILKGLQFLFVGLPQFRKRLRKVNYISLFVVSLSVKIIDGILSGTHFIKPYCTGR